VARPEEDKADERDIEAVLRGDTAISDQSQRYNKIRASELQGERLEVKQVRQRYTGVIRASHSATVTALPNECNHSWEQLHSDER